MEVVEVVEFLAYPHDSGVGGVCGVGIRSHRISYITGYLRALKPSLLKAAYPHDSTKYTFHAWGGGCVWC